jgi:hypothetical protein
MGTARVGRRRVEARYVRAAGARGLGERWDDFKAMTQDSTAI